MKRKFISFFLVIGLFFNNISFSYGEEIQERYAPAVAVVIAPEMVSAIGAFLVASGGTILSQKMLNDVTRQFYEENKNDWDNVVQSFKENVKITSDKMVSIGGAFLKLLENTFNKFDINNNSDSVIDVPVVGTYGGLIPIVSVLPPYGSTSDPYNESFGYRYTSIGDVIRIGEIQIKNTSLTNTYIFDSKGSTISTIPNNLKMNASYLIYQGSLYTYYINSTKNTVACSRRVTIPGSISDYALDLPSDYSSDKLQKDEEGSIGVGIPNTLDKFIDGTINHDNIYNPNYDTTVDGNVGVGSMPGVSNPSIEYGESITIENAGVNEGVGEGEGEGVGEGEGGGTLIPSFPNMGDELDFSPLYMTNIKEKFPFSLPWDFKNLISMFDVTPSAPKFDVPLLGQNITLDFSYFEEWAIIIRFFISISFTATLIFISTKMKG